MRKTKFKSYFIILTFILMMLININSVKVYSSFSDIDFNKPHYNYTQNPPAYFVNTTPTQDWKKTDVDFSGSIGKAGEFALELSKSFNLKGKMPGKLAAVEGSLDFGIRLGLRYNISFGYIFGVDYYHWANDMAVSPGDKFTYCTYVEPDPDKFDLWADISIEPFLELWGNFKTHLDLSGYEIVDWDKSWNYSQSLPISLGPNINLKSLLETGLLTPIGDLYSTPKIGLGIEIPGRLEFDIGFLNFYFDFGAGAFAQFQIKGLIEDLLQIGGNSGAQIDGNKGHITLKYYDIGKDNIKSIEIRVPASSLGKTLEIISKNFKYKVEPGILIGTEGHINLGFHLHIPTPTIQVEKTVEVVDEVCDWLPFGGWACHKVTKVVKKMVDVVDTICDDIDYNFDWNWNAEKEWWIPFFSVPLLSSSAIAVDKFTIMSSVQHPLTINQNWKKNLLNYSWNQNIGPSAIKLNAYAGYSFDLLMKGMLYSYYKKNDQIAGHPFNYYASVDGVEAGNGMFGGWFAAGYGLDLKIPYINEWVPLIGYNFNTSQLSGLDLPLFEAEYTCGIAAISLSGEAQFADLNKLEIAQSANGFIGEWTTSPFFSMGISLDGKLFEVINMNLGSVDVDFLLKGTSKLSGDISASGAGAFDSHKMVWDKSGDINYANIFPKPSAQKGDIIDILLQNLKYTLNLSLVIRITAKLYAGKGYLEFTYDFEIPIVNSLQANVNENIHEKIPITKGFNPSKITQIPEEVIAGTPFQIVWETANSSNGITRLQYGKSPYPKSIFLKSTSFLSISQGISKHNATIILNQTGIWYFVAYLQSSNPPFYYYSEIKSVLVKPKINFTSIPVNITAGKLATIQWNIFGPSSVESTNILWSTSPVPEESNAKASQIQSGSAGTYSTQIKFDNIGTYYSIARAKIDKNETEYYTAVRSIEVIPNIKITVLPSPNNASKYFDVNWTIYGATHVDRTYIEYSQYSNFSKGVYSTRSQFGYKQHFSDRISIYVKGIWYLRVLASVNGIAKVYYSILPLNFTEIYPYSEINPAFPKNVTAGMPFKLYWWVFGYNSTVNKTQIYYDNDTNVFDNPLGSTTPKSGNQTDYSDTFTINKAGWYYFQANFSIDNELKSWNSSIIKILVKPQINITDYPNNATAFTHFNINYLINGLNINSTSVDLWFGETENISEMTLLNKSVVGGTIFAIVSETGRYYFAINLTFEGKQYWTKIFTMMILPNIRIKIPWNDIPSGQSQTNPDMTPGQFAIAGIPVTFEWIVSNVSTVNHTD
ncbi:MAG: hypothetical protein ACTSXT_03960, partial [Candidatus Helarchaeota archaeon]